MDNIELSDDQAQRMLIIQMVTRTLTEGSRPGINGTKPPAADDILQIADWIYDGEPDGLDREEPTYGPSFTIDEDKGFFENLVGGSPSLGDLLKAARNNALGKPSDAEIERFMIDWATTEEDTPEAIATEVFHPTPGDEVLAGFMTAQWRIKDVTKSGRVDETPGPDEIALSVVDRLTGEESVIDLDNRAEELQIVCGACTERERALVRFSEATPEQQAARVI